VNGDEIPDPTPRHLVCQSVGLGASTGLRVSAREVATTYPFDRARTYDMLEKRRPPGGGNRDIEQREVAMASETLIGNRKYRWETIGERKRFFIYI
jgi:hypothetical protein